MGKADGSFGTQIRRQSLEAETWRTRTLSRPRSRWKDNIKLKRLGGRGVMNYRVGTGVRPLVYSVMIIRDL